MNMRSTVFACPSYKLESEKGELDKAPASFVFDAHNVLGDIQQQHGKPRKAARAPSAGLNKAPGEENWVGQKQMGCEGSSSNNNSSSTNSNKGLLGHSKNMEKVEVGAGGDGVRDAGPDPPAELAPEGRWRSVRKVASSHGHTPAQASCLRQILLLQLDLIEQQQQQLQAKDKEIEELKADKETLVARIERMERRLQLVKKDTRDKRLFQPLEPWTPDKDDFLEAAAATASDSTPTHTPKSTPFSRGSKAHKRKFCFLDSKTPRSRGKSKFSPQKEFEGGLQFQRELRSKETPEKTLLLGDTSPQPKDSPHSCAEMEELPYMATTEMYLCRWHQPPPSPLREPSPKKEEVVAIPSWRENCMEPVEDESPDVIENLEDGAFLKRHAKLELDEKRRKRWDIQRIREQRMFQRLQQRMNKRKGIQESEPEVVSFYPDTEDVESLLITPFLPVVAFGRPLPRLTQQNFDLPWLDERSRCRIEMQKKQTPHRTCRK